MLFRVLIRFFDAKGYFHYYFCLLSARISNFENDYSKDLSYIFYLFVFKPIFAIVQFIIFCLNIIWFILTVLIKANNIFLRFVFIKMPLNFLDFIIVCFEYKVRYFIMEFVFMFVDTYIFSFKNPIKSAFFEFRDIITEIFTCYSYDIDKSHNVDERTVLGSLAMEMYPDEYEYYREGFDVEPGPNLNVYYPMRFALSSIMIRLTGIILAISFFFILFFLFTNLFITINANPSELRRTLDYKFIETVYKYSNDFDKYRLNFEKYNNHTFYSTFKCMLIIIYTQIKVCYKYLFFDAYYRFQLTQMFVVKYLILGFFYNFFIYVFIYVLPIHFYYVVYHSYKIIYISTYVGYAYATFKKFIKFIFRMVGIVLKKIWSILYEIATAPEPHPDFYGLKRREDNQINKIN